MPVLNQTLVSVFDRLSVTKAYAEKMSLLALLIGFGLISLLLIAQIVVNITGLARKNFRALQAIVSVPRAEFTQMKDRCDKKLVQLGRSGEDDVRGDSARLDVSDSTVPSCCGALCHGCFRAVDALH